jgi:aminoglycoside 6'-N-acetyltransferase I
VSEGRPRFTIADLVPGDEEAVRQVANLLVEGFRDDWPEAWPDMDAALREVRESFGEDRISRVALDRSGEVLGWIGGIPSYDGNVWELHPLVVRPDLQRGGIGSALVADLEERVRERGALTLWLGSDDDTGMRLRSPAWTFTRMCSSTSRTLESPRGHPYEFYQKLGFSILGAMPDANGPGKPDIYMAKRCS